MRFWISNDNYWQILWNVAVDRIIIYIFHVFPKIIVKKILSKSYEFIFNFIVCASHYSYWFGYRIWGILSRIYSTFIILKIWSLMSLPTGEELNQTKSSKYTERLISLWWGLVSQSIVNLDISKGMFYTQNVLLKHHLFVPI